MPIKSLRNLWRTIRFNGGLRKSLMSLFVRDSLKMGILVGEDKYGNRYYENDDYFLGRNRWVHYVDRVFLDYDASQVAPEWHGWLHNRTDLPPHQEPHRPDHPWIQPNEENPSGTPDQYVPYSTTRPKVIAWTPPVIKKSRPCCFPKQKKVKNDVSASLEPKPVDCPPPKSKCQPEVKDPKYRAFH